MRAPLPKARESCSSEFIFCRIPRYRNGFTRQCSFRSKRGRVVRCYRFLFAIFSFRSGTQRDQAASRNS